MTNARRDTRLPLEIAAVWLLFGVVAVEVLVTYWRLPPYELYHVTGHGLSAGLSRVLVFSNFPTALVAIPIVALLADRASSRLVTAGALAAVPLCLVMVWPGVVDQGDLDAKPINAAAAVGVLIALLLTAAALHGGVKRTARRAGDRVRLVAAAGAVFVGLPWIAAEAGFFLDGVPGLRSVFQTGRYRPPPWPPAVHHGHHHGMDGVLFLLTAALLSRLVPSVHRRGLRLALGAYLALMVAYAVGNIANDFWTEQVFKRGWTTWEIPNVLRPGFTAAWGLIVLGAAVLYACAAWWSRTREPVTRSRAA